MKFNTVCFDIRYVVFVSKTKARKPISILILEVSKADYFTNWNINMLWMNDIDRFRKRKIS